MCHDPRVPLDTKTVSPGQRCETPQDTLDARQAGRSWLQDLLSPSVPSLIFTMIKVMK